MLLYGAVVLGGFVAAMGSVVMLVGYTRSLVGIWGNSERLWRHAISVGVESGDVSRSVRADKPCREIAFVAQHR